jgi:branched-chain amino acid transport system ATP-binding protein
MMVNGAELLIEQLVAGYGSTTVIDAVNLSLAAGERLAVLGRNGVGKTTLLSSVMGIADQFKGRIIVDRIDVSRRSRSLNVEENLVTGLKRRPRRCLQEAYRLFPRLAERRASPAAMLSGGEQQMLSIARTLLGEPRLLLLDEPLEGLAPVLCDEVMEALSNLVRTRRMTVILVEQRTKRAVEFADRVIFLERGRVAFSGSAADVQASPALVDRYVGMMLRDETADQVKGSLE